MRMLLKSEKCVLVSAYSPDMGSSCMEKRRLGFLGVIEKLFKCV